MAVVLSRLDPPTLREALGGSGHGGWIADAGGGWAMLAAVPALGESGDDAAYALAAAVRDVDAGQPVVLLWQAEPDSGYLLQRGRDADSHVWGVSDPAAPRGDSRAAARLLGDPGLEVPWRAALRSTDASAAAVRIAELIGAGPDAVAAALSGAPPAGAEPVAGPPPCLPASVAGPDAGAAWAAAGRSRRGLLALAAIFAVAVAADAIRLGTGTGTDFGGVLALVLFSVLAVICLAVSVGLRRSLR